MQRARKTRRDTSAGKSAVLQAQIVFGCTALAAVLALVLCSAVAYRAPDPGGAALFAAAAALLICAVACGICARVFAPGRAVLCALIASGEAAVVMLLLSLFSGGPGGFTLSVYAAFVLAAVLAARISGMRLRSGRHKRR